MANIVKPDSVATPSQTRVRASLTTALVLGFGTLIFVGMVVVQGISMWSAQKNTRTLLARNADAGVLSLVREARRRLAPVQDLNEYVAGLIDSGQLGIEDRELLGETLLTAMAGTEQVFGMGFVYPDGRSVRVQRGRGMLPSVPPDAGPWPAWTKPAGDISRTGVSRSGCRKHDPRLFGLGRRSAKGIGLRVCRCPA